MGNPGRRLRFHKGFQFDLACDHFHNVFDILAVLLLLQLFCFFQHKFIETGAREPSGVFTGQLFRVQKRLVQLLDLFRFALGFGTSHAKCLGFSGRGRRYLLFGFFFLASGFDLFGRGAKMPLDFAFFLLRRAFPEDILVLRIRLGKIVEAESLREFQVATAFRIALDGQVNAPFNFRGRTFSATAEVLIVLHLELSNIFFECSQVFVDGGHTRGKTSNHNAKRVEENRQPNESTTILMRYGARGWLARSRQEEKSRARHCPAVCRVLKCSDGSAWKENSFSGAGRILARSLQQVINATGVILHTNLGRAPLPETVVDEYRRSATQYSNLEYDLEAGARGKRDVHTAELLMRLTGAEAAIVVNNCAAAVLVALAALARGGEVIVSRGELIEIGDGFRIPEIMEESGAILREVGTTNRTRLADYENAINEKTRALLRVHPSTFKHTGLTETTSLEELVSLSQRSGLPLVEDLGSGCLVDLSEYGVSEPTVRQSIDSGVSLVMLTRDQLLRGPQAGVIAGKRELIARVRRYPLFRALRVDKLTIAALEATLGAYLRAAWDEIPTMRMIRMTPQELKRRAENFIRELRPELPLDEVEIEIADGASLAGGGSTPSQSLPTKIIRIASARYSATKLEQRLRRAPAGVSVIARVEDDRLILDLRTVFPEQEPLLVKTLAAALH